MTIAVLRSRQATDARPGRTSSAANVISCVVAAAVFSDHRQTARTEPGFRRCSNRRCAVNVDRASGNDAWTSAADVAAESTNMPRRLAPSVRRLAAPTPKTGRPKPTHVDAAALAVPRRDVFTAVFFMILTRTAAGYVLSQRRRTIHRESLTNPIVLQPQPVRPTVTAVLPPACYRNRCCYRVPSRSRGVLHAPASVISVSEHLHDPPPATATAVPRLVAVATATGHRRPGLFVVVNEPLLGYATSPGEGDAASAVC